MDSDDLQVGSVLSRREALKVIGVTGAALLAGCTTGVPDLSTGASEGAPQLTEAVAGLAQATTALAAALPACVVRPAMTEGPYFVDEGLNRSDIRSDPATGATQEGVPLELTFLVSRLDAEGCLPLEGALVDVWHCDALGVYSDVSDPGFNTEGQKFLRGLQATDAEGAARFVTIYPGWYQGRTVHIHFKIRLDAGNGSVYDFTSQLFFDDALSDEVYTQLPYANKGERTVRNDVEGIFQNGGEQMLLDLSASGDGYVATFDIGLQIE